jgi:hypothetical protein
MAPKKSTPVETEISQANSVVPTCPCSCQESYGYGHGHHRDAKVIITGIVLALFGFILLAGIGDCYDQGFRHGYMHSHDYRYSHDYVYPSYPYAGGGMMSGVVPDGSTSIQTLP